MKWNAAILLLLCILWIPGVAALPHQEGSFIPDRVVIEETGLVIVADQTDLLGSLHLQEFNKDLPSKKVIIKKKGKGIIIKTDVRITNPETGTISKRSEKQADELFRKLETIERDMLTHNPPPEEWRPARK
jgi:hypothetical protein